MVDLQRRYWNNLAKSYQASTSIALNDFHYGPLVPGERQLNLLPELTPGDRVLELGCGGAQNSVWLAGRGMDCTAIDISSEQLRQARAIARRAGVKITFKRVPMETFHLRVATKFHLIHSSHAFEFVDDPAAIIRRAAVRLLPGGALLISTVHPLYNGEWVESLDEHGRPDGMGLLLRNYFQPPDDARFKNGRLEVISRAYPVASWFDWMRAAGLEVIRLVEPPALPRDTPPPYNSAGWDEAHEQLRAVPGTLIVAARRPG